MKEAPGGGGWGRPGRGGGRGNGWRLHNVIM